MKHWIVLGMGAVVGLALSQAQPLERAHACSCVDDEHVRLQVERVDASDPETTEFWEGADIHGAVTHDFLFIFHEGENASLDMEYR